ncbi:DNA-processing protein DprA [Conservatibacter flavescens]|uniref:DNA-protecting protein DprA n=1 Tax=Conservatibacter flavescens TaxID=28161 RepID=A0A2M8RZN4_9PAST|nr:DNA-processing protein DprA [Conservatibacter flavescens]PJG84338.1 DNA-protecting protein DprA [Conservatibacter flavescens]
MDKNLEVLLRLQQIPKFGAQRIQRLLTHVSPEILLDYDAEALQQLGWNHVQIQAWFTPNWQYIDPAIDWASKEGNHLIHYFQKEYPYLLKQIDGAPPLLFVKGSPQVLSQPQIAIVGSRYCSSYGEYWAKYFASELSGAGFVITSGLALGIDGFAHQATVEIQGQTIGVLGNGLEKIYPARHRQLAQKILENQGALVSEFFPEQPPVAENFPRRNRIISGLSLATLVIEATEKSGSLITARYALEQNRDIFALPGNIQNQFSQGCHKLIKEGAMLVENIQDIIENLSNVQSYWFSPIAYQPVKSSHLSQSQPAPSHRPPDITPDYPELFAHIGHEGLNIDELSTLSGLPVDQLLIQLLALELQDLIMNVEGKYKRC